MPSTEDKLFWVTHGMMREVEFIKAICPSLGLKARINPARWNQLKVVDLEVNGKLSDLKVVSTPFYTAGYHYKLDPQYAVAINHKDVHYYRREDDLDLYYWVKFDGEKRRYARKVFTVEPMHCVCRVSFKYLDKLIQSGKAPRHTYGKRKNDAVNARDSYLFDLRWDGFEWLQEYDDLFNPVWCFLDLETTGIVPDKGAVILSIGAVAGDDKFYTVIKPSLASWRNALPKALKVNGLRWKDVRSGVKSDIAGDLLLDFLANHNVFTGRGFFVGHNISFDMRFLKHTYGERYDFEDVPLEHHVDLNWLYRLLAVNGGLPHLDSPSSDSISKILGILPEVKPHNALNGAIQAQMNFMEMTRKFARNKVAYKG